MRDGLPNISRSDVCSSVMRNALIALRASSDVSVVFRVNQVDGWRQTG